MGLVSLVGLECLVSLVGLVYPLSMGLVDIVGIVVSDLNNIMPKSSSI